MGQTTKGEMRRGKLGHLKRGPKDNLASLSGGAAGGNLGERKADTEQPRKDMKRTKDRDIILGI